MNDAAENTSAQDVPILDVLGGLARCLQATDAVDPWRVFENAAAAVLGAPRLFTVLAYDADRSLMYRLHSSRSDVSPAGGAKLVTASEWATTVLKRGEFFLGSSKADLKSVFSEHESLWAIGCESVLNIPVRKAGSTIGTFNLLGSARQYDVFNRSAALVLAQLAAPLLSDYLAERQGRSDGMDTAALERV